MDSTSPPCRKLFDCRTNDKYVCPSRSFSPSSFTIDTARHGDDSPESEGESVLKRRRQTVLKRGWELSAALDKFFRALFTFRLFRSYCSVELLHGFVLVRHLPTSSPFDPRRTPASLRSIPENCYRIFRLT